MRTISKHIAAVATAAAAAGILATATPASAADNDPVPTGGGKRCIIEHDLGGGWVRYEFVEPGTRVGFLVCGSDGNWHVGWLINPIISGNSSGPVASAPTTAQP